MQSDRQVASGGRSSPNRAYWVLALVALTPVATLLALYFANVPLGKPGKFTYLYAQFPIERLMNLVYLVPLGALLLAGAALADRTALRERRVGAGMIALATLGLAVWSYVALPDYMSQHAFNFVSPSHDGAFVFEVGRFTSPLQYLRDFPAYLRTDTPRWGGTRVISNPPGTTMVAWITWEWLQAWPDFWRRLEPADLPADAVWNLRLACAFSYVIAALSLLAIPVWVAAVRSSSRPGGGPALVHGAGLCAVVLGICFTPATLLFSPGKDVLQLVTVGLLAWAAWNAVRRGSVWAGALVGVALWVGLWFSLVHAWVAMVLAVASLHHAARNDRTALPRVARAFAGAAVALVVLAVAPAAAGIDFFGTMRAVAAGQTEVTRGADAMPFAWQALGIPLFLIFCGPMALFGLLAPLMADRLHDPTARFGRTLTLVTCAVLLITVGFTNVETPRLWIPFAAMLCVGGALQLPAFRRDHGADRRLVVWLLAAQLFVTGAQFVLMDMRETEMRLRQTAELAPRLWW